MKKLKLSSLQIGAKELLTREQMKAVYGGSGDEGGSGIGNFKCRCENGATASVSPCTVTGSGWDACEWFCQDKGGVDGCGFW